MTKDYWHELLGDPPDPFRGMGRILIDPFGPFSHPAPQFIAPKRETLQTFPPPVEQELEPEETDLLWPDDYLWPPEKEGE